MDAGGLRQDEGCCVWFGMKRGEEEEEWGMGRSHTLTPPAGPDGPERPEKPLLT